ncbi:MAG TPA: coiled coil domain-containing protein [Nitrospirota bacterium]
MKTKKEKYIDKMAEELREWSAAIDELEAKMSEASAEARAGYAKRIQELKQKRDALTVKLRELGDAGSEAWDALKSGVETSWEELKRAVHTAKEKFKKAA